jgi:uncharacterized delta-60 repeat protein
MSRRSMARRSESRRRMVACLPRVVEVCEPRVLLAAGDLDLSFGTGGVVQSGPVEVTQFSHAPVQTVSDLQGRILVAATFQVVPAVGNDPAVFEGRLVRFTATGQLDTSFGTGGAVVPVPAGAGTTFQPGSVAVEADGNIVWAYTRSSGGTTSLVVQRYSGNGALLTTFDTSGVAAGPNGNSSLKLFIQPGGKVVFEGVRFLADGTRDLSFGGNGAIALGDSSLQAMQPDGTLIATKTGYGEAIVSRFTVDGLVDTGFGINGVARVPMRLPLPFGYQLVPTVSFLGSGKLLIAYTQGTLNGIPQTNHEIVRLHSNGAVDDTFSRIFVDPLVSGASLLGPYVQPDGKILIGVLSDRLPFQYPQVLFRYRSDGVFEAELATLAATATRTGGTLLGQSGARVLVTRLDAVSGDRLTLSRYELGEMDYRQLATPFYRAYNPTADYHFFTTSQGEFRNAVQNGYRDEAAGNTGFALLNSAAPGATALYRLYNLQTGRHYYTANAAERDALVALNPPPPTGPDTRTMGWRYETIEGYIFTAAAPDAVPIFRLYNQRTGTHLYTENAATKEAILSQNPGVWFEHEPLGFAYPTNGLGQVTAPAAAAVAVSAGVLPASVVSATLPVGSDSSSSLLSSSVASLVAISGAKVEPVAAVAATTELVVADAEPWRGSATGDSVDDLYARVGELADLLEEA